MMLSAEVLCYLPGVGQLTVIVLFKANRKGLHRLRHQLAHKPNDDARINATTQKCSQRHFTHQAYLHRVFQKFVGTLHRGCLIVLASRSKWQIPVTLRANLSIFINENMRSWKLRDTLEERVGRMHEAKRNIVVKRDKVHL